MDARELEELRKQFVGKETYIVSTDNEALTMVGDNGIIYHQCNDHTWSDVGEFCEGSVRWQGSAFHGHGIRLKPLYIMQDGKWINVFTGKQEVGNEGNRKV